MKSSSALLAALLWLGPASAQVGFGLGAGPNVSSLVYDESMPVWNSPTWEFGFTASAFAELSCPGRLSLVPELRFAHLRSKVVFKAPVSGYFRHSYDYLSVPLALRFAVVEGVFDVEIGPEASLLLSARSKGRVSDALENLVWDESIASDLQPWNFAVFGGVVVQAAKLGIPLEICARYRHGLVGIAKEEEWYSDWTIRELLLSFGYRFRFG